jgi:hypothetical protein
MTSTPAPFITNSSEKILTTEAPQTRTVLLDSTATLAPVYSAPIYKKATDIPKFAHVKSQPQMLLNQLQPVQSLK